MTKINYIDEIKIDNKRIIIRVDYNVPLDKSGKITDDTRIRQSLPTLNLLLKNNNKLILVSHLGKPKGRDEGLSLRPVAQKLQEFLPAYKIILSNDFLNESQLFKDQDSNQILILENIRFYPEEKKRDPEFSKQLASLADIFVLDGFAVAHRDDASVCGIAQIIPGYGGLLLKREIEMISKVMNNPNKPLVSIIGGAKTSTKIGLIKKLMDISDYLLIGGAMANNFFKAQGLEIGKSLYEPDFVEEAKKILESSTKNDGKLLVPTDVNVGKIKKLDEVTAEDNIMDIGTETEKEWEKIIAGANTIIWNGPVGCFENDGFSSGSNIIFQAIVDNKKAVSVVGGGDTLACIARKPGVEQITHVSTGGGAMLEFIEKGTLPGIEALKNSIS